MLWGLETDAVRAPVGKEKKPMKVSPIFWVSTSVRKELISTRL